MEEHIAMIIGGFVGGFVGLIFYYYFYFIGGNEHQYIGIVGLFVLFTVLGLIIAEEVVNKEIK